jgi:hypothetical protein
MMTNDTEDAQESFIIPAHTLRGSRQEMLQDIDQAIVGLLALRHFIGAGGGPRPAAVFQHGDSMLHRMWAWVVRLPGNISGQRAQRSSQEAL